MFLVCQVMSQDHVTKGYNNVVARSILRLVTILPNLMAMDTVVVEI